MFSHLLAPGEEKVIRFTLPAEAFKVYNNKMEKVFEPGTFQIMVGTNSKELQRKKVVVN